MTQGNQKLFGTDGIRGRANHYPITPDIVLKVGQALGVLLKRKYKNKEHSVLIGKDTRISGYMLEQALASGLNSMGVWVQLTGPLPTPGIGFLAQNMRVSAGVVISASHNPYHDNGIKIFFDDGFKISSQDEQEIETLVFSGIPKDFKSKEIGRTRRIVDAAGRYIVFAKRSFPEDRDLRGVKVVLDCAHGAAYKVAPTIFEELGATVIPIANKPTGFNINKGVGALYPQKIAEMVLKHEADIGVSLDGDGDRLILSDEKGRILNGDHILGICTLHLKQQNRLTNNKIVATHLSNSGLEESLAAYDVQVIRSDVGDRNVVETMKREKIPLGGEPSGHIIFLNQTTTGDACIAALNVLAAMKIQDKKLSELRDEIKEKPQVHLNVPIKQKQKLETIKGYTDLIDLAQRKINRGRIFVRFSGTEPVVRVFMEGENLDIIQTESEKISKFLKENLA